MLKDIIKNFRNLILFRYDDNLFFEGWYTSHIKNDGEGNRIVNYFDKLIRITPKVDTDSKNISK